MAGWNALLYGRPEMVYVSSLPRTKLFAHGCERSDRCSTANGSHLLDLDVMGAQTAAPFAMGTLANGAAFFIEGIHVARRWHLRLVVSDADGDYAAAWSALPLTRTNAMFAIVLHDAQGLTLLLNGAEQGIEMILAAQGQPTFLAPISTSVH